MDIFGYSFSLLMGLSLGLIGGGGSILTVPILVYFFEVKPIEATSQSLFIVGSTALIGALLSLKKGEVNLTRAFQFASPSFIGVFLTKMILVPNLPEQIFEIGFFRLTKQLLIMIIFSLLMVMASVAMLKSGSKELIQRSKNKNLSGLSIYINGFLVGCVTGLVGAGGGFLIVPALVSLVGLSMRSAIGTSLLIISVNSLFGFSISLYKGILINWDRLLMILGVALVGLLIGSYYSHQISEKKLKKGFGYFVLIMGTIILIDQFLKINS